MKVRVEDRDAVRIITIDRPECRNAVDRETAELLAEAFRSAERDPGCKVAVLTGGGDHFCAGADLKAFAEGRGNRLEDDGDGPMGPSRMHLSKPVIAAIEGFAVAGGLELAVWCDLRVAAENATLGVFCRRLGVPLIDGGTIRLPRLIGMGHALDLILTGRPVSAKEALQMGLVSRVTHPGNALEKAVELALSIARFPQAACLADRASAYAQWDVSLTEALTGEFTGGKSALAEAFLGARRFVNGEGRHGDFDDNPS